MNKFDDWCLRALLFFLTLLVSVFASALTLALIRDLIK
jgi:hypothetical protein